MSPMLIAARREEALSRMEKDAMWYLVGIAIVGLFCVGILVGVVK